MEIEREFERHRRGGETPERSDGVIERLDRIEAMLRAIMARMEGDDDQRRRGLRHAHGRMGHGPPAQHRAPRGRRAHQPPEDPPHAGGPGPCGVEAREAPRPEVARDGMEAEA